MRASHTLIAVASSLPLLLGAATASAHFDLVSPPTPAGSKDGKGNPPCGPDNVEGVVTPVAGGAPLMLNIKETTRHGGFYRVALALKSCKTAGCFPDDNKVYDSANKLLPAIGPGTSDHADTMMPPVFPVLGDNLFPHAQAGSPETYMGATTLSLPNINCDKCTLQVIEFMAPHGPNGAAGFFYHHCADLKITADPNKPIEGTGGSGAGGSGAGGSGTGGSGTGGATGTAGATDSGAAGDSNSGAAASGGTPTTGGVVTGTSGTTATAGTATTTAGTGTGTGGTGTVTTPGGGDAQDDGGCGIAGRTQGSATALAALGLLFALVRRRRAS